MQKTRARKRCRLPQLLVLVLYIVALTHSLTHSPLILTHCSPLILTPLHSTFLFVMSARVTRSRSKQGAGIETAQQPITDASPAKRTISGRKRKSQAELKEQATEDEPTLQLETAGNGEKHAGEQLKLVTSHDQQQQEADKSEVVDLTETKEDDSSSHKKSEQHKAEDVQDEGWQDGHDDDADYHEPMSPTQLVTLQQTDHRNIEHTAPSLPDDIDLSPLIINRAPVLTLWVAVVAHLGPARLPWLSALTVGKAVASMLARSRQWTEIFEPSQHQQKRPKTQHELNTRSDDVTVLGIKVHMTHSADQQHSSSAVATLSNQPINASQCDRYIHQHFGSSRVRVMAVLKYLAQCVLQRGADGEADLVGRYGFTLYEQFRPTVDGQAPRWGQNGELNLEQMVELGKNELSKAKTEGTQLHLTTMMDSGQEAKHQHKEKADDQSNNNLVKQ